MPFWSDRRTLTALFSGTAAHFLILFSLFPAACLGAEPHRSPDRSPQRQAGRQSAAAIESVVVNNPQSPLVRVCLTHYAGAEQITVNALPGAHLLAESGQEIAAGTGPWTFLAAKGGVQASDTKGRRLGSQEPAVLWRVQVDDSTAQIGLRSSGSAVRHYHGSLEIRAADGELRLINEVGMEPYLQGVVISEIGDGPLEALKAQVIAARTYAISSRGRWKADGYDLRDSVDSQAYNGVEAETADGNRAVLETTGQILTVGGQAIDADFCDDCGGVTAPGDDPNILPRSVSDVEAHHNIRHSPYGTWTLTLSPERLKALVSKSAKARGQGMPQSLLNIEVAQRDISARAQRVRLTWGQKPSRPASPSEREQEQPTESRASFPSRHMPRRRSQDQASDATPRSSETKRKDPKNASSQDPDSEASHPASDSMRVTEISGEQLRGLIGYNVLRSTLFTIRRTREGDFVFEGHGWGHGHGLCQQGALALAAAPLDRDCKSILAHYYPGAQITRWAAAEEEGTRAPHGG